jgi:hypothetical protein
MSANTNKMAISICVFILYVIFFLLSAVPYIAFKVVGKGQKKWIYLRRLAKVRKEIVPMYSYSLMIIIAAGLLFPNPMTTVFAYIYMGIIVVVAIGYAIKNKHIKCWSTIGLYCSTAIMSIGLISSSWSTIYKNTTIYKYVFIC